MVVVGGFVCVLVGLLSACCSFSGLFFEVFKLWAVVYVVSDA